MMIDSILLSRRLDAMEDILPQLDTYTLQRYFGKVFNASERKFLLANWLKLEVRKKLQSISAIEPLPVEWFREND
jgi:hypothetical protein